MTIVVDLDGEPGDGAFLYAWVAVTEDTVGIIAAELVPGVPTPLVMQRRKLAEDLRPWLESLPMVPGKTIQLRRYSMAEVLERLG